MIYSCISFNVPIHMPIENRPLTNANNDDEHYGVLVNRQRIIRTMILSEVMLPFQSCQM